MRALKYTAVLMVILLVLSLLLVGYFFMTANVSIVAFKAQGAQVAEAPELFGELKASVENRTFRGTYFSTEPLEEAEKYALITYTLRISNDCLVPIDMIEVQVVPNPVDVLQLGDQAVRSLPPKSQGDITATILTLKESHSVRELLVTYYVWGVSFTIQETYRD
ncbi:MAG: hypothetical protein FWF86_05495 [Clostridia bacterium]|nr:hypothetical protein [Clostridia bacterium]